MSQTQELIKLNSQTAETIASSTTEIDNYAADLVLRNLAVASDTLTPRQFSELSPRTVDQVLDAAAIAKDIAPVDKQELLRLPKESDGDYQYRTTIVEPLHYLQRKAHNGEIDKTNIEEMRKVKVGVKLAGEAFASIMNDAADNPAIRETEGYFRGNTEAAAKRLARSRESD